MRWSFRRLIVAGALTLSAGGIVPVVAAVPTQAAPSAPSAHLLGQGFTPSHLGVQSGAEAQAITGTLSVGASGVTCSSPGALNGYYDSNLFAQTQAGRFNGAAVYAEDSHPTNFCVYHVNGLTELVQYGTSYCLSYQTSIPHVLLGWACEGNAQWQDWTIDIITCNVGVLCVFTLDNNFSGTDITFWNLGGVVQMQTWDWLGGNSWENQYIDGL